MAEEAIRFETSLFAPESGNWPDLRPRPTGRRAEGRGWCHGGPGIALGRLAALGVADRTRMLQDIEAGLAVAASGPAAGSEYLCCGQLGRADILLEAGRALGRPDWTRAGRAVAAGLVGNGTDRAWFAAEGGAFGRPGLFQGLAGAGYLCLRLLRPDAVPCVLRFCQAKQPGPLGWI